MQTKDWQHQKYLENELKTWQKKQQKKWFLEQTSINQWNNNPMLLHHYLSTDSYQSSSLQKIRISQNKAQTELGIL